MEFEFKSKATKYLDPSLIVQENKEVWYVNDPKAFKNDGKLIYRYLVQLVSKDIDWEGCPLDEKIVDCLITESSIDAISALFDELEILDDWIIVDYWQPEDNCPF